MLPTNDNNWAHYVKNETHLNQNISHHGVTINMTIILDVFECIGRFLNTSRKLHLFLSSGKHVPLLSWAPELPYFPAHKTHRDFFVRNFRKIDECILILVIYWKKTGLLHTKISNHNIIYSSQKPRKSSSLPLKSFSWLFSLDAGTGIYKFGNNTLGA